MIKDIIIIVISGNKLTNCHRQKKKQKQKQKKKKQTNKPQQKTKSKTKTRGQHQNKSQKAVITSINIFLLRELRHVIPPLGII